MRLRSCHAIALITLLCVAPERARADVVLPPDPGVVCPVGSRVSTNHCGTVCIRQACEDSDDCMAGQTCQAVRLCVIDATICGRGGGTYERVEACEDGCGDGECRAARACVPGTDAGGEPGTDAGGETGSDAGGETGSDAGGRTDAGEVTVVTYGCGCRAGGRGARGALGLIAFLLTALALGRRRERISRLRGRSEGTQTVR